MSKLNSFAKTIAGFASVKVGNVHDVITSFVTICICFLTHPPMTRNILFHVDIRIFLLVVGQFCSENLSLAPMVCNKYTRP